MGCFGFERCLRLNTAASTYSSTVPTIPSVPSVPTVPIVPIVPTVSLRIEDAALVLIQRSGFVIAILFPPVIRC